jgi:hypothetical protein
LLADAGLEILDVAMIPDPRAPETLGWVTLLARKPV